MKPSIPPLSRLLDGIQIGLVVGVIMTGLFFTGLSQLGLFGNLNAPACWAEKAWHEAKLPPHGAMSIAVITPIIILAQWSIIGFVAGLLIVFMQQRKPRKK